MGLCFEVQLIFNFSKIRGGLELMRTWAYLRTKSCKVSGYIKVNHRDAAADLNISQATFFRHRKLLHRYGFLDKPGKQYHLIGIGKLRERFKIKSKTVIVLPMSIIQSKEDFSSRVITAHGAQQRQCREHYLAVKAHALEPKAGHLNKYIRQQREDRKSEVFSKGQFAYSLFRKNLGIGNSTISKAIKVASQNGWIQADLNRIPVNGASVEEINQLRATFPERVFLVEHFEAFGAKLTRIVENGPTNYTFFREGFGRRSYG